MAATAPAPFNAEERALKDRAHQLMRKGKLEAAADVYVQLIARNNKDPALRLHHAELCDRLGRKERAIASYIVAAHLLAASGHTARARAALGCGLRISPTDTGLRRALRELSPPPKLTLVPLPPPVAEKTPMPIPAFRTPTPMIRKYVDLDLDALSDGTDVPFDEAETEAFFISDEIWEEVSLPSIPPPPRQPLTNRTVSQRSPHRPSARTLSAVSAVRSRPRR